MPGFLNRCWEFKLRSYACTTSISTHWAISPAPFIIGCHLSPGTALDLSLCCQLHSGLTLFARAISPPFAPSLCIPFQGLWVRLVLLDLDISFWVQPLYVLWLEFNLSMLKAIIDRELPFSCFLPCMSSFVPFFLSVSHWCFCVVTWFDPLLFLSFLIYKYCFYGYHGDYRKHHSVLWIYFWLADDATQPWHSFQAYTTKGIFKILFTLPLH